ncbi:MAG TPA: MarR family transcriptional regulator, partial [Candidatus Saccharimonadales bacterium]
METGPVQMCEDLIALLRHIKSTMTELSEPYGLTPPQTAAMYAISHGDFRMGSVAQTLHCDASNATGIIDRLVSQGLVARQESEKDRRVKTLQLTERGSQIVDEIVAKMPDALGCTRLSAQEREAMHAS